MVHAVQEWWLDGGEGDLEIHFEYFTHGPSSAVLEYGEGEAVAVSASLAVAPPGVACHR